MQIHQWNALGALERQELLERPANRIGAKLRRTVDEIITRVRAEGDAALYALTETLDGVRPASLRVPASAIAEADARLPRAALDALETAIANVRRFHAEQLPRDIDVETMPGVRCQRVSHPLDAVGLYVPAGSAPLPSTAVMLAVPALLAGCPLRVLCTPPDRDGQADAAVLAVARRCGIEHVYTLGGAQAVAAMAYGTESVPKVHKIFGPGNAWVTAAKGAVADDPRGAARDMPAGPSEVLVIADANADPRFVAADLLSQAEHGPDSQVVLLTDSALLAEDVAAAVAEQAAQLSRRDTIAKALAASALIVVDTIDEAFTISNDYAPEHLILQLVDARGWLPRVRNAGSVFLGPWTPESIGDYCSGTNHVLPTYGHARTASGLSVTDFMRQMSVQELSADGLSALGPVARTLSDLEGLDAHGEAVSLRLAEITRRTFA